MFAEINRYFKMASMGWFLDIHKEIIALKGFDFIGKEFIPRASFIFQI